MLTGVLAFLIVLAFFVGAGLGIGSLLHWLLPSIDLGSGTVVGVLAVFAAIYLILKVRELPGAFQAVEDEDDELTPVEIVEWLESFPRRKRKRKP